MVAQETSVSIPLQISMSKNNSQESPGIHLRNLATEWSKKPENNHIRREERFKGLVCLYHPSPFSRGSSQPRDRTQVFHIAGRFFTTESRVLHSGSLLIVFHHIYSHSFLITILLTSFRNHFSLFFRYTV